MLLDAMQKYPGIILIKELIAYTYYSMKMWNNAIAYLELIEDSSYFFRKYDVYFMFVWSYGKLKNRRLEEEYYRKSLEENPYNIDTINNLGFCLYTQKKLTEAKAFVNSGKYKISKEFRRRVEKLDNTNARIQKNVEKDVVVESTDDENAQENCVDLGIERQQFSNEKILEDELTARIESGVNVFGLNLKMYKRKGLYGRQFIIKVYGIICLNSPTKELVEKVHQDKRMRIYEYQISYTEL